MRPVIFLDFDDVLAVHRVHDSSAVLAAFGTGTLDDAAELWEHLFHYSARTNLQALHAEFGPAYVISSSWVLHFTREQLREVLQRAGLGHVALNLHEAWATSRSPGSTRATEIQGWLATHTPGTSTPYLILDDARSGESLPGSPLVKRAVLCEPGVGFTYPKLREARAILAGG